MMTLGEILDRLYDETEINRILLESGDMPMLAKLACLERESQDDRRDIALRAVDDFTRKADNEAWVKLVGRVQNSSSPAGACLSEMIAWSLVH